MTSSVHTRSDNAQPTLPQATAWRALEVTRFAVLDDGVVERMAHYPGVIGRLLDRSVERSRRLAVNMAIVHRPRVDIRLQMLFWHLADRWGRPCDGRMMLPLRLTHTILADLVAAQRPTISGALADLQRREIVVCNTRGLAAGSGRRRGTLARQHNRRSDPPLAATPPDARKGPGPDPAPRHAAGSSCVWPTKRGV